MPAKPLVVFLAACAMGVGTLGIGVSQLGSSDSEFPSASSVVALPQPVTTPLQAASPLPLDPERAGVEGPRLSAPAAPRVDIPIQQEVIEQRQPRNSNPELLPAPVAMPVETEWVPGVDPALLSPEKVTEILAAASLLKDVQPFAPGSGPNSTERMESWLASDRTVEPGTPRAYAVLMLVNYGWGLDQWPYLDRMWWHESGWDPQTVDESQGNNKGELNPLLTWGIPQAFPASKMASAGDDWATNPETQIRWGLGYIQSSYGSPQQAWEAWRKRAATGSYGWY